MANEELRQARTKSITLKSDRPRMPPNILVVNVHSFSNAGDTALTQVAIQQLKEMFPQCRVTIAADDLENGFHDVQIIGSLFHWVKGSGKDGPPDWRIGNLILLIPSSVLPVLTYRLFGKPLFACTPAPLRRLIIAYLDADLVVSKPGGFLYSAGLGLTLMISAYTLALALLANKPLYIFPQSIGPLTRGWERALIKSVLNKSRVIMVREAVSLQQLRSCGITHPRSHLLPDMAFAFTGAPQASANKWLQDHGISVQANRPLLGVTAINWGAQNSRFRSQATYETACVDAIRFFVRQYGGKAILFSQVWGPAPSQDDRIAARRIALQLSDLSGSIVLVESPMDPGLLKALYGQMDVLVGTRMHSNIFALSEGVPVIAIGYQPKTPGIAQMLGIEQWVIDIQQINSQELIDRLAALWAERDVVRRQLQQALPPLMERARQAGAIVAADYSGLRQDS